MGAGGQGSFFAGSCRLARLGGVVVHLQKGGLQPRDSTHACQEHVAYDVHSFLVSLSCTTPVLCCAPLPRAPWSCPEQVALRRAPPLVGTDVPGGSSMQWYGGKTSGMARTSVGGVPRFLPSTPEGSSWGQCSVGSDSGCGLCGDVGGGGPNPVLLESVLRSSVQVSGGRFLF